MSRAPDMSGKGSGKGSRAWLLTPPEPRGALLRAFLVKAPGFHAFWSWYLITVVHLRPEEGLPAPVKSYPEAEFEIAVQALNPGPGEDATKHRPWDPDTDWPFERLTPANIVEQFHGLSESGARILLDRLVSAVTRGILSPDSDWKRAWKTAIAKSARGLRAVDPTPEA